MELIGDTFSSKIYRVCDEDGNCNFAMKHTKQAHRNEINIQNIMAKHGLAPRIFQVIEGDRDFGIIMESLDKSLDTLLIQELTDPSEDVVDKVILLIGQGVALLDSIHALGYSHNDAHTGNFMQDENERMYMIDFEFSDKNVDESNDIIAFIEDVLSSVMEMLPEIIDPLKTELGKIYGDELMARFRSFRRFLDP
jgi:tRNA A-37 threonylcarbamoyl transferase component Bud32